MIETPRIVQTSDLLTAFIHLKIPRDEIQAVMGPGLGELRATLAAQGIAAAGPWFTHHRAMDPKTFDFEICLPVVEPVGPVGRVEAGRIPAAKVVRTVYHGAYQGLGAAWGEFDNWIRANGFRPAPDLWECYVSGPELDPDPATYRTELNRPLID